MRAQRVVAAVAAVGLVATACSDTSATEPAFGCVAPRNHLTIATGNSGGVYYKLGGGMAELINGSTPLVASTTETGGSVENIQKLLAGDIDVAFSLADSAEDAKNGTGSFAGEQGNVTALARIHSNYTHVVVRADSGISSLEDMRGKKISTGAAKSGTEVIAYRLLEAAGLHPATDISAQQLSLEETVAKIEAGQIDGFFWSGGLPTPEVTDLMASRKNMRFLDISDLVTKMRQISFAYTLGNLPADTYGLPADVPSIVVPNLLLVRSDFPTGEACVISKLIFDNKSQLVRTHPAANELDRTKALQTVPIQLHRGAKEALLSTP
jgi:TRAP transporter TAXI family solute receptor